METTKVRQSNLELLRIVAMFLVLMVHANFLSLKAPIHEDGIDCFVILKCFVQSISIVCVNVFILISGYFGIKLKIKSITNFLFQCFFFSIGVYWVLFGFDNSIHNWRDFLACFLISKYNWFIAAYLGLLMLSPVFNVFIERCSCRQLGLFIIIFFCFSTWFGYIMRTSPEFHGGFSFISFSLLYCIGRFVRLHPILIFSLNKYFDLGAYVFLSILNTIIAIVVLYYSTQSILPIYNYNNPIIILSSVSFFLFFLKLNFQNRVVNWIAASAFAVFLLHVHPLLFPYYCNFVNFFYLHYPIFTFILIVFFYMIGIFIIAVLIDKCRLWIFRKLYIRCEGYVAKLNKIISL